MIQLFSKFHFIPKEERKSKKPTAFVLRTITSAEKIAIIAEATTMTEQSASVIETAKFQNDQVYNHIISIENLIVDGVKIETGEAFKACAVIPQSLMTELFTALLADPLDPEFTKNCEGQQ